MPVSYGWPKEMSISRYIDIVNTQDCGQLGFPASSGNRIFACIADDEGKQAESPPIPMAATIGDVRSDLRRHRFRCRRTQPAVADRCNRTGTRQRRSHHAVDLDKRAGRLLPDGSIGLRERNSAVAVTNSQVGARIVRSTAGEVGSDVRGEVLSPNDWRRRGTGTGGKCAPQRGLH